MYLPKIHKTNSVRLAIPIDDFLVSAPTSNCITYVINMLRQKEKIKDLGTRSKYLGWHLNYIDNGDMHIPQ